MENLKFGLFSVVTLAAVGFVLFWAITSIQTGSENKASGTITALKSENQSLKEEISELKSTIGTLESELKSGKVETPTPVTTSTDTTPKPAPVPKPTTTATKYKNQALIDELEKLVKANVFLKEKSQGAAVGTVQKFLNLYNKTSNKIDNDYGATTKSAVSAFQKEQGLTADGEAGPGTFRKMIEWLKKQG